MDAIFGELDAVEVGEQEREFTKIEALPQPSVNHREKGGYAGVVRVNSEPEKIV